MEIRAFMIGLSYLAEPLLEEPPTLRPGTVPTGRVQMPSVAHLNEPASPGFRKLSGALQAEIGIVRTGDDQTGERKALERHGIEAREPRLPRPGRLHVTGGYEECAPDPPLGLKRPMSHGSASKTVRRDHCLGSGFGHSLCQALDPIPADRRLPVPLLDAPESWLFGLPPALPVLRAGVSKTWYDQYTCCGHRGALPAGSGTV
jgi:hypothetical protein